MDSVPACCQNAKVSPSGHRIPPRHRVRWIPSPWESSSHSLHKSAGIQGRLHHEPVKEHTGDICHQIKGSWRFCDGHNPKGLGLYLITDEHWIYQPTLRLSQADPSELLTHRVTSRLPQFWVPMQPQPLFKRCYNDFLKIQIIALMAKLINGKLHLWLCQEKTH